MQIVCGCGAWRAPTKQRICAFAAVGSASHWSGGLPAAEMSPKVVVPVSDHGKQMPFAWMQ